MEQRREKLIAARLRRRWSQARAAEECGVGLTTYQNWEYGKQKPHLTNVYALCKIFNATPTDLGLEDITEGSIDQGQQSLVIVPAENTMSKELQSSLKQDLTAKLMKHIMFGARHTKPEELKELHCGVSQTIEDHKAGGISRRNAVRSLLLLPLEVCAIGAAQPIEDILVQCTAGLAAGWYVQKGYEKSLAFDAITAYIPAVKKIAESSLMHRPAALSLLAHCYLLKGELARHLESNVHSVLYLDQAEICATDGKDILMQVIVPRTRAATHYLANHPHQAARDAEKARDILSSHKDDIPKHIHSFVHAGLATYQANIGKHDEAKKALKLARGMYIDDASLAWFGHDHANVLHNVGMTHFRIAENGSRPDEEYKIAADTMQQLVETPTSIAETIEHVLDRARVEINRTDKARDMELCIKLVDRGIQGATDLHSEQRFIEANDVYAQLRAAWPTEPSVKELRQKFIRWDAERTSNA